MKTYNEYKTAETVKESNEMDLFMEYFYQEFTEEEINQIKESVNNLSEQDLKDINEGVFGSIFGGLTGALVGDKIGKIIANALGVQSGVLYDLLTSKLVAAALGAAIGKRL